MVSLEPVELLDHHRAGRNASRSWHCRGESRRFPQERRIGRLGSAGRRAASLLEVLAADPSLRGVMQALAIGIGAALNMLGADLNIGRVTP